MSGEFLGQIGDSSSDGNSSQIAVSGRRRSKRRRSRLDFGDDMFSEEGDDMYGQGVYGGSLSRGNRLASLFPDSPMAAESYSASADRRQRARVVGDANRRIAEQQKMEQERVNAEAKARLEEERMREVEARNQLLRNLAVANARNRLRPNFMQRQLDDFNTVLEDPSLRGPGMGRLSRLG